ncbi:MAG TPA: hypothetical protein PLP19_14070 [bacterium]|nr:hypothetical protein [bacterium]HPN44615.1 hypothetical protein [bacterium]
MLLRFWPGLPVAGLGNPAPLPVRGNDTPDDQKFLSLYRVLFCGASRCVQPRDRRPDDRTIKKPG